jgi:peptide/nickel transport system substrate-binding protein
MKTKLINGQSVPTGSMTPFPLAAFNDPALESRSSSTSMPRAS